jgi:HNH endonuclease
MPKKSYSAAQIDYLRTASQVLTVRELTDQYYFEFGQDKKESQIRSTLKRNKIKYGRNVKFPPGFTLVYTDEQVAFIKEKYPVMGMSQLHVEFNTLFKTDKTETQLKSFVTRHKIPSGRTGLFEKGHDSWNKNTRGLTSANKTSFKKGTVPPNIKPFGHERINAKDGYVLIKVDMTNPHTGFRGHYRLKHHVIWEEHNGPIPKGMIIRFVDGDKLNCVIANLEMVSHAEHLHLNRNGYSDTPEELKPAVKAIVQLSIKAREMEKQGASNGT